MALTTTTNPQSSRKSIKLRRAKVIFFSGSGKIRTQTSILTWGENYIFVWKNLRHSVPDTIDHYFIAENDGWRAAIVTLPTDQDETVENWLRDQFGAAVSTGVRQWGIIYSIRHSADCA